jgi:hypothetical protein
MSGSPVVDDDGYLVGVVSESDDRKTNSKGTIPCPHLALSCWLVDEIKESRGSFDFADD